jgi:hypothetical protein
MEVQEIVQILMELFHGMTSPGAQVAAMLLLSV